MSAEVQRRVVIDPSDLEQPRVVARVDRDGNGAAIEVQDDHAYLTNGTGRLPVFDLTQLPPPRTIHCAGISVRVLSAAVVGRCVHLAEDYVGLEVLDLTDVSPPARLGTFFAGGDGPMVAASDRHLLLVAGWEGLVVL